MHLYSYFVSICFICIAIYREAQFIQGFCGVLVLFERYICLYTHKYV